MVLPRSGEGVAIVVSKRAARLSVTRHRIKRQVSEALRDLQQEGYLLPPSFILFPRSFSVDGVGYQDIRAELAHLLKRAVW